MYSQKLVVFALEKTIIGPIGPIFDIITINVKQLAWPDPISGLLEDCL